MEIGGLRTLLPEKLINPTRFALENPGRYEPEKLAAYLQTAAHAGSRDVGRFKKDWHSDDMRELWQTVHANELPQGGDAWAFDYGGLLQQAPTNEKTSATRSSANQEFQPPNNDAEIAKTVNDFRTRHPELKMHVSDEANLLPIDISIAQMEFRVERKQSAGGTEFTVTGKPSTEASPLRDDVLQSIRSMNHKADFTGLLVGAFPIFSMPLQLTSHRR